MKSAPEGSIERASSIEKLINLANYSPQVSLQEGLKRTFLQYQNNYKK